MTTYLLEKTLSQKVELTEHVQAVIDMFGVSPERAGRFDLLADCEVSIKPGDIVLISGGSGAGKTTILNLLKEQMGHIPSSLYCGSAGREGMIDLDDIELPRGKALVDCLGLSLGETFQWLSLAGLSEVYALLRTPEQLSEGQRYRLKLALALSEQPAVIFIDECCATLDRITAAIVACHIRKCADIYNTTFIVATSHDDLIEDLAPDVVVVKGDGPRAEVYYPKRI